MRRSTISWMVAIFATVIDVGLFYYEGGKAPENIVLTTPKTINTEIVGRVQSQPLETSLPTSNPNFVIVHWVGIE